MKHEKKIAAIYARVSTKAQIKQGNGIDSQIASCREYCKANGYEIDEIYTDDITGKSADRTGLTGLKSWVKKKGKSGNVVIVVDAISRVARDVEVYQSVKRYAYENGATFASPTFQFEDSPAGRFMETIHVGMGQFEREDNAQRVRRYQRMRLADGYWCLSAPLGYRSAGKGNPIEPNALAPIVKEALEGFASGRFESAAEVKRFIEKQPEFITSRKSPVLGNGRADGMLCNVLYAGYIDYPKWEISLRKAKHEPLIDYETFLAIQERLKGRTRTRSGNDTEEDFPLRGFVLCDSCGRPLTGGWSRSKSGKKYAYYHCFKRGCERQGKSVPRQTIEDEFVKILSDLQPHKDVAKVAANMLRDLWDRNTAAVSDRRADLNKQVKRLKQDQEKLLDRILATENDTLVVAYEERIARSQSEQARCEEKLAELGKASPSFDELFEHTLDVLSNSCDIWKNRDRDWKSVLLKAVFSARLRYSPKTGLRTPETTFPFKVLQGAKSPQEDLAERQGFEPWRRFPAYTLSRRAPSTTRPPLRGALFNAGCGPCARGFCTSALSYPDESKRGGSDGPSSRSCRCAHGQSRRYAPRGYRRRVADQPGLQFARSEPAAHAPLHGVARPTWF